jgi:hypothetical protein
MRIIRLVVPAAMLAAVFYGSTATGALASAAGDVTATRSGMSPFYLTFAASGTPSHAQGGFRYKEPGGYTVTGKVTCYYQKGKRAVMTGPVTNESLPVGTEAFVVSVMDGTSPISGNPEGFDVAGTSLSAAADCKNNFPLDNFDYRDPFTNSPVYYLRTSGDIVVR